MVLAGKVPIELQIEERAKRYWIKRTGEDFMFGLSLPLRNLNRGVLAKYLPHPANRCTVNVKDVYQVKTEIYTDGSRVDSGTGASFVVYEFKEKVYNELFTLESYCFIYQAELLAIEKAVDWCIINHWQEGIRINTDSRSALEAMMDRSSTHAQVFGIHSMLRDNHLVDQIHFKWVRAHAGIIGNERADYLAKEVAKEDVRIFYSVPMSWVKKELSTLTIRKWQEGWIQCDKGRRTFAFLPNVEERIGQMSWFKMQRTMMVCLSGHDGLGAYKQRFNLSDESTCVCEEEVVTLEHLVYYCPQWQVKRHYLEWMA
ncbi:uncharacterized protein [Centruroides vittatus]|uniref:uncharacterized protein n=1 Tax=Centruroides vittatus TaxID=120091 RepID=UPI00350EB9AD